MHAVVEYIDRHLDQKLDLAVLAGVAHFSPFHFHRLFHALMGEALGDYLRRRRLETAATRLRAQLRIPVLDVALAVGFGSAEAFTRAFRVRFGCSPTQWRNSKPGQVGGKPRQAARASNRKDDSSPKQELTMNVRLVDREPVRVAYLRHTGPYGPALGVFWMTAVAPWMQTNHLMGRDRFGISLDDPAVTKPAQCRYDACVASPEGEVLSGDPGRKVIPGGKYAMTSVVGDYAKLGKAWEDFYGSIFGSGLKTKADLCFERYINTPADTVPDELITELYAPLA